MTPPIKMSDQVLVMRPVAAMTPPANKRKKRSNMDIDITVTGLALVRASNILRYASRDRLPV